MLALVLDRTHGCLLQEGRLPDIPHDPAGRPLLAVNAHFAAAGIELPHPSGSRARQAGGRDFVFVVPAFTPPAGFAFVPLRDAAAGDDSLFDLYVTCLLGGHTPP